MGHLHSTIFILKLEPNPFVFCVISQFTFYNIYIKTMELEEEINGMKIFTFYNIYIKTQPTCKNQFYNYIYILQYLY